MHWLTSFAAYALFFPILALWPFGPSSPEAGRKKSSLPVPQALKADQRIRVLLESGKSNCVIETPSPYTIKDNDGHVLLKGERMLKTRVQPIPEGLQLGSQNFRGQVLLFVSEGDGFKINQRPFRGDIQLWREPKGTLAVVNDVDIEGYLKGVLPSEVNPKWPLEMLKAQAVAARTFAIFKEIENQERHFALSNSILGQVYRGRAEEKPASNEAVEQTRGMVLMMRNEVFPAYFHSTCGGQTTHAEYQWKIEPHPALRGVRCDFCRTSPFFRWTAEMSRSEIEKKLKKEGFSATQIDWIRPKDYDESSRARAFTVGYKGKETVFNANDFRVWVGAFKIKSTLIGSVDRAGEKFIFRGKGFGHGVGICQYGARELAKLGYNYRQILEYYYPGVVLASLNPT